MTTRSSALFVDTGIRRAELLGLRPEDLELKPVDTATVTVTGKGSRTRHVAIGPDSSRAQQLHAGAGAAPARALPWLWLAPKGRLGESGLAQLVRRRGEQAGLKGLHPHHFRSTYATMVLAAGMQEGDLMAHGGWRDPKIMRRYALATKAMRAAGGPEVLADGAARGEPRKGGADEHHESRADLPAELVEACRRESWDNVDAIFLG